MSEQNPYERLGISEDASFEEIQDAKTRLSQEHRDDTKVVESVEAAYDAIIMERLRMRQEGKIKVPERIRFPERSSQIPSNLPKVPAQSSPQWLQQLLDTPSQEDILWSSLVFGGLVISILFAGQGAAEFASLAIAIGLGANLYFLNRKENRFGRSLLLTFLGLVLGLVLGSVLGGLSANQLINLSFSREAFDAMVTLVVFWLISSFLR